MPRILPLLVVAAGLFAFATAATCGETAEDAVDKGSAAATAVSGALTATSGKQWHEPVRDPVIGVYGPGDGDHQNADEEAIDFEGALETPIFPMADGVVAVVGANCQTKAKDATSCYGNTLVIEHDDGFYSIYAHLAAVPAVAVGEKVSRADAIALMGSSGCVECGTHLHFVVRKNKTGLRGTQALFLGTPVPIRGGVLKPR